MAYPVDAPPDDDRTSEPGAAHRAVNAEDARLISESLRDPERFTAVYDRHYTVIYRYVAGRLGSQPADDIAAETFLVAFRRRKSFDQGKGTLRSWLFGIATKLVSQHRRTETRRYQALARVGADPAVGSHEERVVTWVTAEGLQPQLARALAALSAKERDVVLLVALSGLGHDEVAAALGIPYGTVGSRLNRARRKLRAALELEGL
ncbi:RNA polymerase sigma factor [Actinomadura sp. NAK00032]|uniref:RNA polymerase sigma factor n=1 Tax=Actinomadura sp. NAK00032 TaxID=2742128 RepID=UPI0015929703|nr:RNA polymerase sigma factor [Actinomadura sp. NAK00032]QKW39463.1 RNA polymerase sigma factor [Actinomadura sp. NAK00032]